MKKRVKQDDTTTAEGKNIPRLYLREVSPTDDDGPYEGIGTDLRAARVETGVDISGVADNLRISKAYLEAIEEGRFADLPGGAYVYGFLRSYAEYLDLDPKAVIAEYKSESELPRSETKLAFPSPMDQGRLPTGRLLASSLVLAGLVYAGWYVVSGGQQKSAEVVSAVPERFATIIENSSTPEAAGRVEPGIAAPVQSVDVSPAGPPNEALIAGETPSQGAATPAREVASATEAQAPTNSTEPALPRRRPEQAQVAALAPEAAVADNTPVPIRVEEQAAIAPADEFGDVGASAPSGATPTSEKKREEAAVVAAVAPAPTVDTRPKKVETREAVVASAPVRKKPTPAEKVAAAELPPIVVPVLKGVPIAAASPSPQQIAEEEQVAAALADPRVIEQAALPAPAPRVATTEPAFLAAERAQIAEAPKRRRLTAADAEKPLRRTQFQQRPPVVAAVEPPKDEQPEAAVRSRSTAVEVSQALPASETETSSDASDSVQLAAARRISELTNNETAANGAVRSFPVPPPIPQGTQTAALGRTGEYVPQVFGASNEDSRVLIEAKIESWVQVRGLSGETLLTRILRVGDKYLVPNRSNLVLMTGNAGALKIVVDGKELGQLGPPGAVLRDVSLDPSQLLARASSR